MDKYLKKFLYKIIVLLIIFIFLLPNFSFFIKIVYSVNAGEKIKIPTAFGQYGAQYEKEDISWISGTGQEAVNKIWVSQGKPADNNNWSYITVGGQKRYLVALAQTFGVAGDYVDIHMKDGKIYPCVLGDEKRLHEPNYPDNTEQGAFWYNGVAYGHTYSGRCDVVELLLKDYSKTPPVEFLNSFANVDYIVNGGSCLSGNGPVGLSGSYVTVGVSVGSQEEWLKTVEDMTNEMLKDGGWIYSNSKNITDYYEAKKATPRRTNCALMVTHALQCFGAFESNMKFYVSSDGKLIYKNSKSRERLEEIAEITHYEKGKLSTRDADLQPGDIVGYYGHTNIYAGLDESGVKTWYDAGRGSTKDVADGSKFTKFKRTTNNIGMDVAYIIRLKYNTDISEEQQSGGNNDNESQTFAGALGLLFRDFWASLCATFDGNNEENDASTVLYSFKNVDDNNSYFGGGNGDIVASCEAVTKMLLARGCHYSLNTTSELICGDIDRQLKTGKYFCCATYVSAVLYHAGVLTAQQINAYNYHYTGGGGVPDMLKAAGWREVPASQAQPGDVVNHYGVHVMIYAGNGRVWDQTSAVVSSSGANPTGTTRTYDLSQCQIWRAPGK